MDVSCSTFNRKKSTTAAGGSGAWAFLEPYGHCLRPTDWNPSPRRFVRLSIFRALSPVPSLPFCSRSFSLSSMPESKQHLLLLQANIFSALREQPWPGNGRKGMRGLRARTTLKQAPVCSELMSFRSARELLQPAGDGRASSAFCRLYVRATVLSSDPHCFRLSEGRNFLLIDRVMHQSDGLRYGLLRWLIVSIVWTGTNA